MASFSFSTQPNSIAIVSIQGFRVYLTRLGKYSDKTLDSNQIQAHRARKGL